VIYASGTGTLASSAGLQYANGTGVGTILDMTATSNTNAQVSVQGTDGVDTSFVSLLSGLEPTNLPSLFFSNGLRFATATNKAASGYAEQMRLTSTGLGIGTSSPAAKLSVRGNGTTGATFGLEVANSAGNTRFAISDLGDALFFGAALSETMRLDSSGNLGLGVTPSAWALPVGGSVIEMVQGSSIAARSDQPGMYASVNAYHNGTNWIYKTTAAASQYFQNAGAHSWSIAPSGTAGNTITFTQAMTLTAAGKLGIGGSTAPDFNLSIGADFFGLNFSSNRLSLIQSNSANHSVALSSIGSAVIEASTVGSGSGFIEFRTLNTERVRVSDDGYLRMASGSGGIQFNGDTAAANALDDYEEGVWTPALSSSGATFTYGATTGGEYVKIGKTVILHGVLTVASHSGGTSATGLFFSNLPFAPGNVDISGAGTGIIITSLSAGITVPANYAMWVAAVKSGTSVLPFYSSTNGGGVRAFQYGDISATPEFQFSLTYMTA
jgi:hypothetical protein